MRFLSALWAALAVVLVANAVHADCGYYPSLVWTYPADGDVDVPTDARFWMVSTAVNSVKLDGVELLPPEALAFDNPSGAGIPGIEMPGLQPNREYTIEISFASEFGPFGPRQVQFSTSSRGSLPPTKPVVQSIEYLDFNDDRDVNGFVYEMGCLDGGESEQKIKVNLEGDAFAWKVKGAFNYDQIWPQSLGLPAYFRNHIIPDSEPRDTVCYTVTALNQAGDEVDSDGVCLQGTADEPSEQAPPVDLPEMDGPLVNDAEEEAGCSIQGVASPIRCPHPCLLLLMALWAVVPRRSR